MKVTQLYVPADKPILNSKYKLSIDTIIDNLGGTKVLNIQVSLKSKGKEIYFNRFESMYKTNNWMNKMN